MLDARYWILDRRTGAHPYEYRVSGIEYPALHSSAHPPIHSSIPFRPSVFRDGAVVSLDQLAELLGDLLVGGLADVALGGEAVELLDEAVADDLEGLLGAAQAALGQLGAAAVERLLGALKLAPGLVELALGLRRRLGAGHATLERFELLAGLLGTPLGLAEILAAGRRVRAVGLVGRAALEGLTGHAGLLGCATGLVAGGGEALGLGAAQIARRVLEALLGAVEALGERLGLLAHGLELARRRLGLLLQALLEVAHLLGGLGLLEVLRDVLELLAAAACGGRGALLDARELAAERLGLGRRLGLGAGHGPHVAGRGLLALVGLLLGPCEGLADLLLAAGGGAGTVEGGIDAIGELAVQRLLHRLLRLLEGLGGLLAGLARGGLRGGLPRLRRLAGRRRRALARGRLLRLGLRLRLCLRLRWRLGLALRL